MRSETTQNVPPNDGSTHGNGRTDEGGTTGNVNESRKGERTDNDPPSDGDTNRDGRNYGGGTYGEVEDSDVLRPQADD